LLQEIWQPYYREISLTVNLCKGFESLVRDEMINHLEKHVLINDTQLGFVRNKSCLTNLLVFVEEVTKYLDSVFQVDVIYLDFQKAVQYNEVTILRIWELHSMRNWTLACMWLKRLIKPTACYG